jgi:Tfp pilus assembly protein PilN
MGIITLLAATAEQVEADWAREFFGLEQEQRFVVLILGIIFATVLVIVLVGILSGAILAMHRRRDEGLLKRELIERGMSAEEITMIVEATAPRGWLEREAAARKKK